MLPGSETAAGGGKGAVVTSIGSLETSVTTGSSRL